MTSIPSPAATATAKAGTMQHPCHPQRAQCDCDSCERYRLCESLVSERDVMGLKDLVHEVMVENLNIGMDLDYRKCVLNGSWPGATEILKRAFAKAIVKKVFA